MHNLKVLSFFFTNKIGAPHDEMLARINPFYRWYSNLIFSSLSYVGVVPYGALEIG